MMPCFAIVFEVIFSIPSARPARLAHDHNCESVAGAIRRNRPQGFEPAPEFAAEDHRANRGGPVSLQGLDLSA